MNISGVNTVNSVFETFVKANALINVPNRDPKSVFFRGQMDKSWNVISRLYRSKKKD